jgi:hypothetical protein
VVVGFDPRALHMLHKHSTIDLHLQLLIFETRSSYVAQDSLELTM